MEIKKIRCTRCENTLPAKAGFVTCGCGRVHWVSETGDVTGLGCLGCQGNLPAQLGLTVCPFCGQTHWVGQQKVVKFDPGVSFIPTLKTVATLFLTTVGDKTPGEVASLWEQITRVHKRLEINGGNADTLRGQIDQRGGEGTLAQINQLKYAVGQVDSLTEELAKMLNVTQEQLFEDPPRSVVEAAKDVLYYLIQAAKRLDQEWGEIARDPHSGNWDTEYCLRRDKHIEAEKIRKTLLSVMDLPLDWDGGA